jgi:hypothetical protein
LRGGRIGKEWRRATPRRERGTAGKEPVFDALLEDGTLLDAVEL